MAESVKRLRTGAKRAVQGAIDHALRPKRLDFEAEFSPSSEEEDRTKGNNTEDEENCDPVVDDDDDLAKRTPPHSMLPLSLAAVRLHGTSAAKRPRAVRLLERPQGGQITSPVTAPRPKLPPRLLFLQEDTKRRRSAPAAGAAGGDGSAAIRTPMPGGGRRPGRRRPGGCRGEAAAMQVEEKKTVRKSRLANINPFTPTSLNLSSSFIGPKEDTKEPAGMYTPTTNVSFDQEDFRLTLERFMRTQNDANSSGSSFGGGNASNADFQLALALATPDSSNAKAAAADSSDITAGDDSNLNPSERLRVSDVNIARYEEEFVELRDVASGVFGKVKIARHRLDGMVYAIKVTRSEIAGHSQERAAMNEVFAHAALMKHKHVVRYYNSWVENGRIYIQNEYCEGGSLANLIDRKRRELEEEGMTEESGKKGFSENELKRIATHLAKGLQYIHSKGLVHLDIKPENVFIALDHLTANASDNDDVDGEATSSCTACSTEDEEMSDMSSFPPPKSVTEGVGVGTPKSIKAKVINDSTDSGNASDGCCKKSKEIEQVSYKIGDLGHVAQTSGDYVPEEGDCRYFAPELLLHEVDREKLPKADIFSLGLTLYECATLTSLPKNSGDDPVYQKLRSGSIPYVNGYSKEFNQLIKLMTDPDVMTRPSAGRVLSHPFVRNRSGKRSRSNLELYKELKSTRQKLKALESQMAAAKSKGAKRLSVGRGTKKSKSSYQ